MTHSNADKDLSVGHNTKNTLNNYENEANNELKKPKRVGFRNKALENFSLASPTLNKRYRFSVLPTVI